MIIESEDFIAVKSYKAKGKRITTFNIESVEELPPTRFPEPEQEFVSLEESTEDTDGEENEESPTHKIIQGDLFGDVSN